MWQGWYPPCVQPRVRPLDIPEGQVGPPLWSEVQGGSPRATSVVPSATWASRHPSTDSTLLCSLEKGQSTGAVTAEKQTADFSLRNISDHHLSKQMNLFFSDSSPTFRKASETGPPADLCWVLRWLLLPHLWHHLQLPLCLLGDGGGGGGWKAAGLTFTWTHSH